jgi:1-deoxy-D-xylulose-5-phosphate synthase
VRRAGGSGLALLVFGALLDAASRVAEQLDATLVSMRFIKPLDRGLLRELTERHVAVVTIEDNAVAGGAGSAVAEALATLSRPVQLMQLGVPDRCIEHGARESCLADAGLDTSGIAARIEEWWGRRTALAPRAAGGGQ